MKIRPLHFVDSSPSLDGADTAIVGLPWDGTASYRGGARFGPDAIRIASDSIETFDPNLGLNLFDVGRYVDLGNAEIDTVSAEEAVDQMRSAIREIPAGLPVLGLGGEHSVTLPLVERALSRHPDLACVVFDAHADLRETYEGSLFSHACVTYRVLDLVGPARLALFGVRSGTKEEFALIRKHSLQYAPCAEGIRKFLEKIGDAPIYISVDVDGFDPALVPGTGTVEAGGYGWGEFSEMVHSLKGRQVVGADVVELAPDLDPTGRSSVLAAQVARILLGLILSGKREP